jgi:hypothetical protein
MRLEVVRLPVDSISIWPEAISLVPGATYGFTVSILDSAGRDFTIDPGITVGTNPPGIATANGYQVTGMSLGTTSFSVSADDVTASAQVKVVQVSFTSVNAGSGQACGVNTEGLAFCWSGLSPVGVVGDQTFDVARSGGGMSCGLDAGVVLCWGGNPGNGESYLEPTAIPGAPSFTDLVVGDGFACGLASNGSAHCWGGNSEGELGDGTLTRSATPTTVGGGHVFVALAAGRYHACGLTGAGEVYCWGGETNSMTPRLVSGTVTFASISGGYCGLDAAGVAYCWDDTQITPTPTAIPGFTFTTLSGQTYQICGLQADGSAWCWDRDTNAPTAVTGGLQFVSLTTGFPLACGTTSDGLVYCWTNHSMADSFDPTRVKGQP